MTAPHTDGDPLQMSPGEKLAAEREARHDARARGSSANPAAVQDYLRHTRSEQLRHPAPVHHPAAPAEQPAPAAPTAEAPPTSWLHRLLPLRRPRG